MIDPDGYIDEYYQNNQENLNKPPKNKYANLNFSRLQPEKKLVQINLIILLKDNLMIKDKFDWDLTNEKKSPEMFSNNFVEGIKDIIENDLIEYNRKNIKNQILDQLISHIEKNCFLPRLRLIKKENENSNNQFCNICETIIFNQDYCVNCMTFFEKKVDKKTIEKVEISEESRPTERQRLLELRQKNLSFEEIAVSYAQEGKEKKICKKCGEVNLTSQTECRNCKYKFPIISYFDINMNCTYSVHFWDKIKKNSTIQQIKNFSDFFTSEDFNSLKYLYNKIKYVIKNEFQEILTEEAYDDLIAHIDKIYFSYSNQTNSTEKIFDSAYLNKFNKLRPKNKMLNFNELSDIKEGWLNDNLPDKNIEEKKEEKIKSSDPNLKRKRGRPKKMEIFRNDSDKLNETQITLNERDNLLKNDLIITDDDLHYDFCGKCDDDGKLICCETCSSSYHYECLGYDKFPRGKFKCYYCKIIKLGIDNAVTVDKSQMKLIKKLITYNRKAKWLSKAQEFLDVLIDHHCSSFFMEPIPEDFKEFLDKIKDPIDLNQIQEKLKKKDYSCLKEFIKDLSTVWNNFKEFYNKNSFFYKQADTMEIFMTHLIKEEGVFDTFNPDEEVYVSKYKDNEDEDCEIMLEDDDN